MKNRHFYSTNNIWKSLLLALPMLLIMLVFMTGGHLRLNDTVYAVSFFTAFIFFGTIFFMMLYTGKTDKYRAIAFVASALLFCISFIYNIVELRGSMTFSDSEILSCEIPFCHIVTTMVIIPAAIKQTIIFPGSLFTGFASISGMLVIVLGFSIVLGRGFCSWGCFYGGWDDGASRIGKKTIIGKVNTSFKWFSFAMLLTMALWSAITLSPSYCDWLCPFKAVTENEKIVDATTLIKNIVFFTLFVVLVIILPILTHKRIQCATFCPMGALLSLTNKINIFSIKTDTDKCVNCKKCETVCPMLAIDASHQPLINCSKCGKCVDNCPTNAIKIHIKGTPINGHEILSRTLFLYPAFAFMVIFLSGSFIKGLMLIINFVINCTIL